MTEPILLSTEYTLVIDTNGFAYNFAKKLCGYCTGHTSEDEEDQKCCDLYDAEMDNGVKVFAGFIMDRKDEDDNWSPCTVWVNKRYGYNSNGDHALLDEKNYDDFNFPAPFSVGIFFDVEPTEYQIHVIRTRSQQFFEKVWPNIKPEGVGDVRVEGLRLIIHRRYGEEIAL